MPVAYKNMITGRVVERDDPDPVMDRSKKWQRVEDEPKRPRKKADDGEPKGDV